MTTKPCDAQAAGLPGSEGQPALLSHVLAAELEYIRRHRHPDQDRDVVDRSLVGLALSGGGIRSATTNLGVLQALSRMEILPMVDYVSTVSGGGYIGACLSSLLSWNGQLAAPKPDVRANFTFGPAEEPRFTTAWDRFPLRAEYEEQLQPDGRAEHRRHVGAELVAHLRTHGNFLIARWGVLRRETMRSIGNLLTGITYSVLLFLLTLVAFSAIYLALIFNVAPALPSLFAHAPLPASDSDSTRPPLVDSDSAVVRLRKSACTPGAAGCEVETRTMLRTPTLRERIEWNASVLGSVFTDPATVRPLLVALVVGALLAAGVLAFMRGRLNRYVSGGAGHDSDLRPGESAEDVFERPLLRKLAGVALLAALATLFWFRVYPASSPLEDAEQFAWLLIPFAVLAGAWLAGLVIAILLLPFLWTRRMRSLWGAFQAITVFGGGITLVFAVAPVVIYALRDHTTGVGLGAIGSLLIARLLTSRAALARRRFALPTAFRNILLGLAVTGVIGLGVLFFSVLIVRAADESTLGFNLAALIAAGLLAFFAFFANPNRLSPHYFYQDRLAETYLLSELADPAGGMRLYRDAMEMPLCCLHGMPKEPEPASVSSPQWRNPAPYHLISAAINLAGSRDLTRKDRKSGYWLFSKLYCGSVHTGFCPTASYQGGETKLTRAVAISGAAASSAMGQHTFFAQAFATVLFNIRLGYWMPNPSHRPIRFKPWPRYLWREVVLNTTETLPLVNLSDGGHTGDNIGIYPLLQRRCKVIIACDAERDPALTFGSFTEALRQAYIDMGIDIDIDLTLLRPDPTTGLSRSHCAVGRIRYPDRPGQESYLIYLKSSLTNDEPEPVLNYKSRCPDFPHETTADQFFDDAQFESYRALGVHLAEHTFARWIISRWFPFALEHHRPCVTGSKQVGLPDQPQVPPLLPDEKRQSGWRYEEKLADEPELHDENQTQERRLDWSWFRLQVLHTPFRATDREEYLRLTRWLKNLEMFFLRHPQYEDYYRECFAEEGSLPRVSGSSPEIDHIASNQAHFMEEVFFGLQLDRHANAPDNRGWMNLFRRWGRSPTFNRRLDQLRSTLTLGFLEFYDHYLRYYPYRIDEHPIPHCWDPEDRRQDPRDPKQRPPEKAGGKPGPVPTDYPPSRRKVGPSPALLPGLFLDSGVREVRRRPPRPGARPVGLPGKGAHGVEEEGEAPAYEVSGQDGSEAASGSAPVAPNE